MRSGDTIYRADIAAGGLKVRETRIIADLLLRRIDSEEWRISLFERNLLQVRNPETTRRYARLIKQRLDLMKPELWELIRDGSATVATHATLAAAVKHSRLLGDFLYLVVREHYRLFKIKLSKAIWEDFLEDCKGRDPSVGEWYESTRNKLKRTVFQILAQAGYLEDTRNLKLQPVHIASEVIRYLEQHNETYVLRCLEVPL